MTNCWRRWVVEARRSNLVRLVGWNDLQSLIKAKRIDDQSVAIFRVDTESKVNHSARHVTADQVTNGYEHLLPEFIQIRIFDAVRVEQLLRSIPQLHKVSRHAAPPELVRRY